MARWSRKAEIAKEMAGLALTAEEGFVLSRLDSGLTREQVVELTGLAAERVDQILALLEDKGLAVSDTPSIRPISATIPDPDCEPPHPADDEDLTPSLPAAVPMRAASSPPPLVQPPSVRPPQSVQPPSSVQPPPWSEPPPRKELELDPNLHDPSFRSSTTSAFVRSRWRSESRSPAARHARRCSPSVSIQRLSSFAPS